MGPTASGKTGLALTLAQQLNGQIVNADSVQVYRRLTIGAAKPTTAERAAVPHHLIDVAEPDDPFSVGRYRDAAVEIIDALHAQGVLPLLVGGTNLWLRALEQGIADMPEVPAAIRDDLMQQVWGDGLAPLYARLQQVDPEWAAHVTPGDTQRIVRALSVFDASGVPLSQWIAQQQAEPCPYAILKLAPIWPREVLYARINQRFDQMMEEGFLAECAELAAAGYDRNLPALKAVGYRQLLAHVDGAVDLATAVEDGKRESRRYAKRQSTWLAREPELHRLEPQTAAAEALKLARAFLADHPL
ncbi:tRNA (adenosine(37)-N6)-dimethylallyltransferase MiaA [Magnetofaba australis]|nr:tRNA (adenosine(37)-N6)-dimethylallyltransferase MiaA [Magnetofaba australis]